MTDRTVNTLDKLARALYYTYTDIVNPPDCPNRPHWHHLTDREKAGWENVAAMAKVLVNAAIETSRRLNDN